MLAAVAVVLVACGDKKADTSGDTTLTAVTPPASTTTGTTHEVQMVQEGENFKYLPEELTIKAGDIVVFKSVSGGLHNVQFYPDSIPPGAQAVLDAAIPNRQGPVSSELLDAGQQVSISFAGAPAGEYKYFCMPHLAMGMNAKINVTM